MSSREGATSFLANPAVSMFNGDVNAYVDGAYLNPIEIVMRDDGYAVAAMGAVLRDKRTNASNALGVVHYGLRVQSEGTVPMDAGESIVGPINIGIDMTQISSGQHVAIAMRSEDGIFFNGVPGTSPSDAAPGLPGDILMAYSHWIDGVYVGVHGGAQFQVNQGQVTTTTNLSVGGHLISNAPQPSVSACGSNASLSGTDTKGSVGVGSGAVLSCQVTFASPFWTKPVCVVSGEAPGPALSATPSPASLTIRSASNMAGSQFDYVCVQ